VRVHVHSCMQVHDINMNARMIMGVIFNFLAINFYLK